MAYNNNTNDKNNIITVTPTSNTEFREKKHIINLACRKVGLHKYVDVNIHKTFNIIHEYWSYMKY